MIDYLNQFDFKIYSLLGSEADIKRRPSLPAIEKIMNNLEERFEEKNPDRLIFYFSGHGCSINDFNYLCFPEMDPTDLSKTTGLLDVEQKIIPFINKIKPKFSMVLLDCCQEKITKSRGIVVKSVRPEKVEKKPDMDMFFAYSSKPGGYAFENRDTGYGYFTEYLIREMDRNINGSIDDICVNLKQGVMDITEEKEGQLQIPLIMRETYSSEAKFSLGKKINPGFDVDDYFGVLEREADIVPENKTDTDTKVAMTDTQGRPGNISDRQNSIPVRGKTIRPLLPSGVFMLITGCLTAASGAYFNIGEAVLYNKYKNSASITEEVANWNMYESFTSNKNYLYARNALFISGGSFAVLGFIFSVIPFKKKIKIKTSVNILPGSINIRLAYRF